GCDAAAAPKHTDSDPSEVNLLRAKFGLDKGVHFRGSVPGVSGRQSLCLSMREGVPETAPQSALAWHCQVLGPSCVRKAGRASPHGTGEVFRELMVKSVGKPDARKGHVRFDERGRETGGCQSALHRALPRLYSC